MSDKNYLSVWSLDGKSLFIQPDDCKTGDPMVLVDLTQENVLSLINALIQALAGDGDEFRIEGNFGAVDESEEG